MNIRIYLVSIKELEVRSCYEKALNCLDQIRYNKVCSYQRQKDQCLAIATGLLLQVAYQELDLGSSVDTQIKSYRIKELLRILQDTKKEITYSSNEYGKPYWDKPKGTYHFFNISHSGEYVILVCSDREIGVDIQQRKQSKHMKHSVSEFSKLEAYVKYKGNGFSGAGAKILDYLLHDEACHADIDEFKYVEFLQLKCPDDYIAWICTEKTF